MRIRIKIGTVEDAMKFVTQLNNETAPDDLYIIESKDGKYRCNAKSIVGVFYAITEFDEMWLKSEVFPKFIMDYTE